MLVDALAGAAGIDMRKLEKSAAVGRGEIRGRKVILAKPVTFMNNSGESVAALARFYKVGNEQLLDSMTGSSFGCWALAAAAAAAAAAAP
jgi:PTH1 family peptidyl-tRNA hydrolase